MTEADFNTVKRFQVALPIIRTSLGLTQSDLAKYLDIPKTTVEFIESCKKPVNLVFYWAITGLLAGLANATKNEHAGFLYLALLNPEDEKERKELLDICQKITEKTDEIGIAKAQEEINKAIDKWLEEANVE